MKLKNILARIPRPLKACVCTALVILLAAAYYIALGCPTLTFEQEFRRAEKAHLVGPSQIVDRLDGTYRQFDKMIVGETESGVCFFGQFYSTSNDPSSGVMYQFGYVEKTGDITVAAAPNFTGFFWQHSGISLPVYVFTDEAGAARAEIDVDVTGLRTYSVDGKEITRGYEAHFSAEAYRNEHGVFRFFLDSSDEDGGYALYIFSNLANGSKEMNQEAQLNTVIPVTVRLYDSGGALLIEKELTVRSLAGEARAES